MKKVQKVNKITLQAYTQGIESTDISNYGQDMDKVALDRIFDDPVVHYSALDYMGIDLHDKDLVYAGESDNIGFVSSIVYGDVPKAEAHKELYGVEILFDDTYDITKNGFTIWFHDAISTWKYPTILLWWGEYKPDGRKRYLEFPIPTFSERPNRLFVEPALIKEELEFYHIDQPIKSVIIAGGEKINNSDRDDRMLFLKVDGITWGFDAPSTDIQGDISVYTEISESKTDTPAGSCDLTVVFDGYDDRLLTIEPIPVEPEEGMNFILETDNIKGKYTITSVTRQGENIYNIQATDDIENTGTFVLNNTEEHLTYTNPKMFTKGITTSWNDNTLDDISVKGWVNAGETNRQALAHFSAASNRWITAFNDPVGIHTITERRTNKIITADRILGNAEFKRNYNYKGVEISQELNGIVYVTQVLSKTPQNNSKGWFKLDNFGMRPTADALKNMVIMANNILRFLNGNEVTATIVYDGEQLGDIVTIETPYNGNITGLIKSLDFTIGIKSTIATVTIKEVVE